MVHHIGVNPIFFLYLSLSHQILFCIIIIKSSKHQKRFFTHETAIYSFIRYQSLSVFNNFGLPTKFNKSRVRKSGVSS